MTKEFETLLYLFGDSSLGRKSRITSVENPDRLIDMAVKQGIWSCVYPLLNEICDVKKYYFDFLAFVSKSVARNEFTLKIISEAMKSGIKICILKGISVAQLYANPDYRVSSDTDILIDRKDEKKMADFLLTKGYEVKKRSKNDHHMKATHPVGGLLEVHISLYNEITEKIIFGGKNMYHENWCEITLSGNKYYTLGINDNLVYLTAHYIKHFINGGSSIRQMMDLLLYMEKYKKQIDFRKYEELLKDLKYYKLIQIIKSIGSIYFGFNYEITDMEAVKLLLDDSEYCGMFGASSSKSTSVYNEFCERKQSVSKFKLIYMFLFKAENSLYKRLFPCQEELLKLGYSYSKHTYLIPIAWIHKLFDYVFKSNNIVNEKKDDVLKDRRIETMEKISIFD